MKKILLYSKPFDMEEDRDYNFPIDDDFEMTTERRYLADAVAVIFHMPTLRSSDGILDQSRKKDGQIWVFWSMECDQHYLWQYEPRIQSLFDITVTYRIDSDVPIPYLYPSYHDLFRVPPVYEKKEYLINAFISSGFDKSGRCAYLKELMSIVDVHSYGKVMNNMPLGQDEGTSTKLEIISKYRFTIAFENAISVDYVTEKFFDPLEAGSVPVYLGAPNVEEFAPGDNCFINVRDFSSPRELAAYLSKVAADETLYSNFGKWRCVPYKESFLSKMDINRKDPLVRVIERIKEMQNLREN